MWIINLIKTILENIKNKPITIIVEASEPVKPVMSPPTPAPKPITPRERLYIIAKSLLKPSHDVSPKDVAPDDLACVESYCEVFKTAFGFYPDGTKDMPFVGTPAIVKLFKRSPMFKPTLTRSPGTTIVVESYTGNGKVPHGHIGVSGEGDIVMSNRSATGNWETHLNYQKWLDLFVKEGGMKIQLFDVI